MLDDRLGGGDALPLVERLLADALQIVDVEQAGLVAVVDGGSKSRGTAMSRITIVRFALRQDVVEAAAAA